MAVALILLFAALGFSVSSKNPNDLRNTLGNPVALVQTYDFTLNQNQNVGPYNRTQSVFKIDPVFYSKEGDWAWIHRPALLVLQQPDQHDNSDVFGFGDLSYKGYLTPVQHGKWIWGVGPWLIVPSGSSGQLTTGKYSIGPTVALLHQDGPLTLGATVSQVWSFAGDGDREDISVVEADPIVRMLIGEKTTIGLLDTIRLNWKAESGQKLTVPMGIEVRQLFRGHTMPIEAYAGVFGNVIRPDNSSDWYWKIGVNLVISQ